MLGVREDDEGGKGLLFFVQFATRSLFDVFLARDIDASCVLRLVLNNPAKP